MISKKFGLTLRLIHVIIIVTVLAIGNITLATSDDSTIVVDIDGTGDFFSIQDAITFSSRDDTILIKGGVYTESIVIDKAVQLNGVNDQTVVIDGEGSRIIVHVTAPGVSVQNITIRNGSINVTDNTRSDETAGIYFDSDDVLLKNCSVTSCYTGVFVNDCSNISVTECKLFKNKGGFRLNSSRFVSISNCSIFRNNMYGISLHDTQDSMISYCNISSTDSIGIVLSGSSKNSIFYSTFLNNSYGVRSFQLSNASCNQNMIYGNSFINNTFHAYDVCDNRWYYGSVGNFWDDYNGTDNDNDGVGDEPYEIVLVAYDHYPLMNPISSNFSFDPSICIISPSEQEMVNGTLLVTGEVISRKTDYTVWIRVDDAEWMLVSELEEWETSIDISQLSNGNHTVFVKAVFADGSIVSNQVQIDVRNNKNRSPSTPGLSIAVLSIAITVVIAIRKYNFLKKY